MAYENYPVDPMSGQLRDSNGDVVDLPTLFGATTPVGGYEHEPKQFPAYPLTVVGADGNIYNLADLLKNASGGGGMFVVHANLDQQLNTYVLDHTAQEIASAIEEGEIVFYSQAERANDVEGNPIVACYQGTLVNYVYAPNTPEYFFTFAADTTHVDNDEFKVVVPFTFYFTAESADDYPVLTDEG